MMGKTIGFICRRILVGSILTVSVFGARAQDVQLIWDVPVCDQLSARFNASEGQIPFRIYRLKSEYRQLDKANAIVFFYESDGSTSHSIDLNFEPFNTDRARNFDDRHYEIFYPADLEAARMSNVWFLEEQLKGIYRILAQEQPHQSWMYEREAFFRVGPGGFYFWLSQVDHPEVFARFDFRRFTDNQRFHEDVLADDSLLMFDYRGDLDEQTETTCVCRMGIEKIGHQVLMDKNDRPQKGYFYALVPEFKCLPLDTIAR